MEYYNLEIVTSVGYRVKSEHATQFRIWANKILKEHLLEGYTINQQIQIKQLTDLKNTIKLLSHVIELQTKLMDYYKSLQIILTT